ncbi:MAG: iron-containing alcohol dehydrogenase [Halioglobus sp.]
MSANINLPRILKVGAGASDHLAPTLMHLGLSRPLLVTDPFMQQCGYVERVVNGLEAAAISYGVFADCVPDPTTDSVALGLAALAAGNYDCLVALGGGSSIDTAKAVAAMADRDGPMREYKVPHLIDTGLPVIAIPTTAGTGSEATHAAVITDSETNEKMLCSGLGFMPIAALVDFELTLTMPYRLTADTGIDSLCHALEAYVSRKASPFTDGIALTAMSTIYRNIRTACAEPDNRAAREAMMLAATQGGMAFSNASVTLIHGMSRPIGGLFHVPHGLSNAMLLPEVTAWSVDAAPERYAAATRVMGLADDSDTDAVALSKLTEGLRQLNADLSVPSPGEFGIDEAAWTGSLELMAEQAIASGSPANNPRIPEAGEIIELYQRVWAG